MEDSKAGNSCLYCLFQFCNFLVFFLGICVLGIGMYICIADSGFTWYNGSFVGLGLIIFLTGFLGYKAKYSNFRLLLYCILIGVFFLAQISFTIAVIAYRNLDSILDGASNANIIRYMLIGCGGLLLLCFITSFFYRRSLNNRNSTQISQSYQPIKPESTEKRPSKYEEIRSRMNNAA